MVLPAAIDLQWERQRRATLRAAGGILDLVLPLRVGGAGYPVFCAPPIVGLSWCYLALLPHVDADHPLYGLQVRGLRRPEPLPATMGELARDFADQIRMTQPDGPYHLLGWSLGGNIAFAVAEELERRGLEIGLLTILDAGPRVGARLTPDNTSLLYNFVLGEFGYRPELADDEGEPEARMLELVRGRRGLGLHEWPDHRIRALQRVIRNNVAITRAYQPRCVRGRLLFAAATLNLPSTAEKVAMWRSFVEGPIDVVEVECKHEHMLLPEPLSAIGAAVTQRLARPAVPLT